MPDEPNEPNPFAPPASDIDAGAVTWPTQGEGEVRAERGTRLGAAILDGLLYLACAIPAFVIVFRNIEWVRSPYAIEGLMIAFMLPLAIYQWYRTATTGQSIAKKWLRIKIVKLDGSP